MRSKCRHGDLLTVTYSKNGRSQSLSVFSPLLGGVGASAKYLDGPSSMIGAHPRRSCFRRFREKSQLKSANDKQNTAAQRSRDYPDKVGARLSLSRESGPLPRPTQSSHQASVRCTKLSSILIGKTESPQHSAAPSSEANSESGQRGYSLLDVRVSRSYWKPSPLRVQTAAA